MTDVETVEDFLATYEKDYQWLLKQVREVCEQQMENLGGGVVDDVYTRGDSQGGDEFKSAAKIAYKARQRGMPVNAASFLQLNDIIGLTVVVQYPDQISKVIATIEEALQIKRITASAPERHKNKNGYFATHVVCTGKRGGGSLRCELQFKTLLHNAWASKMHDLTYKPAGMLDPRLSSLMASIAVTVESLEEQSQLIRDMIKAGWNVEHEARLEARHNLFGDMLHYQQKMLRDEPGVALTKLYDEVEKSESDLRTLPLDDPRLEKLTEEIESCCRDPDQIRYGWMIAGRVASLRETPDLMRFFRRQADLWLQAAPRFGSDPEVGLKEVAAVPLVFYVIDDLDRAIDYSRRIIDEADKYSLNEKAKEKIRFNRLSFMVEREYHAPTSDTAARRALREEIEGELDALLESAGEDEKPSISDTVALVKITFGETKEEVKKGIDACFEAARSPPEGEKDVSKAYFELHTRLGWRRYFELETRSR